MSQNKLKNEIVQRSEAGDWETARSEWQLHDAWRSEEFKCLCGQDINKVCQLANLINGRLVVVGCCCVRHFEVADLKGVFEGLRRICANQLGNPGEDLLILAREKEIISDRDFNFAKDVCRRRKLSDKQKAWKRDIHTRIIDGFTKQVPVEEMPEQRRKIVPTERRSDRHGKGNAQWRPTRQEKAKKAN